MKKIIALIVAVLFVFAVGSVSFAADKAAPAAEKKAEPAKAEKKVAAKIVQVTGEVAAVDTAAKTITVKGKKGDVVIAVSDKDLAAVKAGDKVTVKYATADGKNTAKKVEVKAAKKTEKKAEPAKKEETKKTEPAKKPAAGY